MSELLYTADAMRGSSASRRAGAAMPAAVSAASDTNAASNPNPVYGPTAQHATTRWLGTVDSMDLCTKSTGTFGIERVTTGSLREILT
jgi:hypothetical protein